MSVPLLLRGAQVPVHAVTVGTAKAHAPVTRCRARFPIGVAAYKPVAAATVRPMYGVAPIGPILLPSTTVRTPPVEADQADAMQRCPSLV